MFPMSRTPFLSTALALALCGTAPFALGHGEAAHHHDHASQHGGVVVEVKETDFELVAEATRLQLYVRGHHQAADTSQATARLTLLSGGKKQDVDLKPAGDRLEALGSFNVGPGTKVVAVVKLAGQTTTARFVLK
jgi:hypothetical protein